MQRPRRLASRQAAAQPGTSLHLSAALNVTVVNQPADHGWGPGYLQHGRARIEVQRDGGRWERVGGNLTGNDQWVEVNTRGAKWRLAGQYIATSKLHFELAPPPLAVQMNDHAWCRWSK